VLTTIEMPALDGRNPLGFLAALGLLRVLSTGDVKPLKLSFSRDSAVALLRSPLASIDDVVEKLQSLVFQNPDAAVVGLDQRFPTPAGRGSDPMRRPREAFRELMEEVRELDGRAAHEWMPSLFTDLAIDSQGRADLTPFCAPSGKQNLRTFFDKPLSAVRVSPLHLREALVSWRRVDGFTGEYLDHRVINSAADDPGGRAGAERGVPGATWLATMAIPMLRVTGGGKQIDATLWYHIGRRWIMIWPLWEAPLDATAIQVLIEHPCLAPVDPAPKVRGDTWPALGIFAVYGSERQRIPGRNFAGVLAPVPVAMETA
jgi:hypothetical protein